MKDEFSAANQVAQIVGNMRRIAAARPEIAAEEFLEDSGKETKELERALEAGGFPKRHRAHIAAGRDLEGICGEKARLYAESAIRGDCLYIFSGDRGTGKTQVATFWAWERKRAGKSVGLYVTATDLLGEIKKTWREKAGQTEEDALNRFKRASFLVIDEYNEASAGEWAQSTLVSIIDYRYYEQKATVIITNQDCGELAQNVSKSILDRANEIGGVILFAWPSFRGRGRK